MVETKRSIKILPSCRTVRIMAARTVVFLLETLFFLTALRIMAFRPSGFCTCGRVNILTAELFSTLKAPRPATSRTNNKFSLCGQAASENVITSVIFQSPPPTPWTLLRIQSRTHPLKTLRQIRGDG